MPNTGGRTSGCRESCMDVKVVGREYRDFCNVMTVAATDSKSNFKMLMTLTLANTANSSLSDMDMQVIDVQHGFCIDDFTSRIHVCDDKENGDDEEFAVVRLDNKVVPAFWLQYDVSKADFLQ